jgi:hypothetical protein
MDASCYYILKSKGCYDNDSEDNDSEDTDSVFFKDIDSAMMLSVKTLTVQ